MLTVDMKQYFGKYPEATLILKEFLKSHKYFENEADAEVGEYEDDDFDLPPAEHND
jgi:hypothetical protein